MTKVQVFASFDTEHDQDLYEQLLEQSRSPSSGFEVTSGSMRTTATRLGSESVRRRIRGVDQVIVICGEHAGASAPMSAELRIAQEEKTPYILLWGRRETMCTKPTGAKTAEGMYRWTRRILQDQILSRSHKATADAAVKAACLALRKR